MTSLIVTPYGMYFEINGDPLEAGKIYIGEDGLDPQTNPVAIFWDRDLVTPAVQPVRTIAGLPDNNGSPGNIYTALLYSITVDDRDDVLIYTKLSNGSGITSQAFVSDGVSATYTLDVAPTSQAATTVTINGIVQHKDTYIVSGFDIVLDTPTPIDDDVEVTTVL